MGFLSAILDEFYAHREGAGFVKQVFVVVIFWISASVVVALLYAVVVLLLVALYDWWCGTGGDAAVVPAVGELMEPVVGKLVVLPLVVVEAALLVGNELGARAVRRRRRAACDSASGEPGSSSGEATEHKMK